MQVHLWLCFPITVILAASLLLLYCCIDVNDNITGVPLTNNSASELGCDFHKQSWCLHQPKIYLFQYIIGLYILTPGYCASSLICYTMFSKILGPWPQVCELILCNECCVCAHVCGVPCACVCVLSIRMYI